MPGGLFELRDRLTVLVKDLPGLLTVGIGKQKGKLVFVLAVDTSAFQGGAPTSFEGHRVLVKDLGVPVAHALPT